MDLQDVVRHLEDNLNIEISSDFLEPYSDSNNQEVRVVIKLGNRVISESETTLFVGDL